MQTNLKGKAIFHNDLDILETWSEINWMKLYKDKYNVLYLGQNNCMHKWRLGNNWLLCSTSEKNLRVTVQQKHDMSQQCTLVAKPNQNQKHQTKRKANR